MSTEAKLSVREALGGKHILATGVSGFLGKVWLAHLLQHAPEIGRVTLVLRDKRGQQAADRIEALLLTSPAFRSLRDAHGTRFADFVTSKLRVVIGDAGRPLLGVDPAAVRGVDAVVHIAGLTDFQPDPRLALETNVLGTVHAAELAAKTTGKRLLHISTAFVAGNVSGRIEESLPRARSLSGQRFEPMDALAKLSQIAELEDKSLRVDKATELADSLGYPNIYTFSKALAEQFLACDPTERFPGLQWSIARPAVVESSRHYPFEGWNEGVNTSGPLAWALMGWLRRFPSNPDLRFDVIPVDTVARSMSVQLAALLQDRAPEVIHLGSSSINPLMLGRCIDLTGFAGRRRKNKGILGWLMAQSDSVPRANDRDPFPSMDWISATAKTARDTLQRASTPQGLSSKIKDWSKQLRNIERLGSRMNEVLDMYQPFIHDNNYEFLTDNIEAMTQSLPEEERVAFGFDLASLDWRNYWLDVHIGGLEKWCFPILRGERPSEDPTPPGEHTIADRLRTDQLNPEPTTRGAFLSSERRS